MKEIPEDAIRVRAYFLWQDRMKLELFQTCGNWIAPEHDWLLAKIQLEREACENKTR